MTTGEKIRYCREQRGITQKKLADLTGIHPVSIRKYETNKMQPQSPQLERIAAALGVSYNALHGVSNGGMKLETIGDLMGVFMVLCNSGLLQISGERGTDQVLKENTVSIQFSPLLAPYIDITSQLSNEESYLSLENALLHIKNHQIFRDLLRWEKINHIYGNAKKLVENNNTPEAQQAFREIAEGKEKIELELQKSQILLDMADDISVKIAP